jgi:acyl-homoserine-lactone acylase
MEAGKSFTLCRIFVAALILFNQDIVFAQGGKRLAAINPENISIARDSFGIPHIFGKTDAEVAYGLAWASAEDAFPILEDLYIFSKGMSGRARSIEGAKADYFVHAIRARKLVEANYHIHLSAEFRRYIDGYIQGLNAYAKAHRREVRLKGLFPLKPEDLITAYVAMMSFLSEAQNSIANAVSGKYDSIERDFKSGVWAAAGSNGIALSSRKTSDGKTYLCINPHLAME